MSARRYFFPLLFLLMAAARLCHSGVLWAEESLPLAAGVQMLAGKMLYGGIWFDKPPLLALICLLWDARTGVLLRLAGTAYALLAAWFAWRFARDLWGEREGFWAAGLTAFYLTFDTPSAAVPLASDLLMLAPHIGAVWLAWKGRAFWSGLLAGVATMFNPKGALILVACGIWNTGPWLALAAGFAVAPLAAGAWLLANGALGDAYEEVWRWGRVYAGGTFVANPVANGVARTMNWCGFHAAAVLGTLVFLFRERGERLRWLAWLAVSFAAVTMGWRFFPRYFFQVLPVFVLAGARGLSTLTTLKLRAPQRSAIAAAIAISLAVPVVRFGPGYVKALRGSGWRDIGMDEDSRAAAGRIRTMAGAHDTLFVWGFRPEFYAYTRMTAASRFLDSQPLTGVPADRHLTQWQPVETEAAREHRAELARTTPTWIVDGLGPYNPRLAVGMYEDLRPWLARYTEVTRTGGSVIYRLRPR